MNGELFEKLEPVCPVCLHVTQQGTHPLHIAVVGHQHHGRILEGVVECSSSRCRHEYPIIDGIPVLVPNLRSFVQDQFQAITSRDAFHPAVEGVLGDCAGPESQHERWRQHVSSYAWDHYGEFDPCESGSELAAPGAIVEVLNQACALGFQDGTLPPGPALDVGCGPGRTTLELAKRWSDRLVVGIDIHWSLLRVAANVLRTQRVAYSLRQSGLVYQRREFPMAQVPSNVEFWACDAQQLPFADEQFGAVLGLNLLDSVASPVQLLRSLNRVAQPSARIVLGCPYDWTSSVTPVEQWIGGHSPRSEQRGACDLQLRAYLSEQMATGELTLECVAERKRVPWSVRIHDRSRVQFDLDLLALEKTRR